jgi:hypothetical protein
MIQVAVSRLSFTGYYYNIGNPLREENFAFTILEGVTRGSPAIYLTFLVFRSSHYNSRSPQSS